MIKKVIAPYKELPKIWWLLTAYILVVNSTDVLIIYKAVILTDFQNSSPEEISILLAIYSIGICFCNLYISKFIDHAKSLLTWLIFPKAIGGLLICTLAFQQNFLLLNLIFFVVSISLFINNIVLFKIIKTISKNFEQNEDMLVLFSTIRHIGLLLSTIYVFLFYDTLNENILIVSGLVSIVAALSLFIILKPYTDYFDKEEHKPNTKEANTLFFIRIFKKHWAFFLCPMFLGIIYETTLAAFVPLYMKDIGIESYVEKFSIMQSFATGAFFLLPFLFSLTKPYKFATRASLFVCMHLSVLGLYFLLPIPSGWLYALPIFSIIALAGEASLTIFFSQAGKHFEESIFARITGLYEFFIFVGVMISGACTSLFVNKPEIMYSLYLVLPFIILTMGYLWNKKMKTLH